MAASAFGLERRHWTAVLVSSVIYTVSVPPDNKIFSKSGRVVLRAGTHCWWASRRLRRRVWRTPTLRSKRTSTTSQSSACRRRPRGWLRDCCRQSRHSGRTWSKFCTTSSSLQVNNNIYIRLTARVPGLPRWAGTRKVKLIWILLKQETVSGSGISWAMCMSAPRSSQITTPTLHRSVFYRPDALPAAQPVVSKPLRVSNNTNSNNYNNNNKI